MNNTKICPACGSEDIYETKKRIKIKEPFADAEIIEIIENVCHTCKAKGDFFYQNEDIIEDTIKRLKQRSVENILEHFIKNKRSLTSIERALEIPFRTLAKWKNKRSKTSAAGIALLRFIRLFPWLIDVAENKYDPKKAENIMVENSMRLLQKTINTKTYLNTQEGEGTDLNIANFPNSLMTTNSFEHMHIIQEDFEKDTEEVISMCLSSQEKI
jgi:hypothetical protein